MNAAKFIVLKTSLSGEIKELKKYYKSRKHAEADVKELNRRAKVTQSGNSYKLKKG